MADTEQEVKIIERNGGYGGYGGYGYGRRDRDWYDYDDRDHHERSVSWREYQMMRDYEKELAAKDHQLNLSDAERISDKHDIELYKQIRSEIKAVDDKLDHEVRRIDAVNAAQSVYNATNTTMIGGLQRQIDELMHMSKRVIPNSSVCPGWDRFDVSQG